MNKEETEQREISIYWWNMGEKKLDFSGSYQDFLEDKCFKVKDITFKKMEDVKGFRFKFDLSSSDITLDCWTDYMESCDRAIIIYLTLLGDKTIFINGFGREYKINWR